METLVSRFKWVVKHYSHSIALIYNDRKMTYEAFDAASDAAAAGLIAMNAVKGSKIGICMGENIESMMLYIGILKAGATAVFLNTFWTEFELRDWISETDVEILFYDDGCKNIDAGKFFQNLSLPKLRYKIDAGHKSVDHVGQNYSGTDQGDAAGGYDSGAAVEGPDCPDAACQKCESATMMTLSEIMHLGKAISKEKLDETKRGITPADEDAILFTSGSVSSPKGVVTTHASRVQCALAQAEMLRADASDVYCAAIPMFHCFSITCNLLAAWMTGAAVVLPESRKTDHIFQAVERYHCTILSSVPTLYSALLANKNRKQYDISSLRTGVIGGSLYSESFFLRVCRELGLHLISSLGQTEATSCVTCCHYDDPIEVRSATLGHFLPGIEGLIKDTCTGQTVSDGQIGEICFRGFNVMKGYYKRPDLTAKVIDGEGFVHTGDLGFIDSDGNIHMTGRLKEMIIRGGENIAPGEVESAIMRDGRVGQVKVVGIPDEHYGEEVCACVIREDNADISANEIKENVARLLASYKVPRYVLFTHVFPMKANGKIDTPAVRKWAERNIMTV